MGQGNAYVKRKNRPLPNFAVARNRCLAPPVLSGFRPENAMPHKM